MPIDVRVVKGGIFHISILFDVSFTAVLVLLFKAYCNARTPQPLPAGQWVSFKNFPKHKDMQAITAN